MAGVRNSSVHVPYQAGGLALGLPNEGNTTLQLVQAGFNLNSSQANQYVNTTAAYRRESKVYDTAAWAFNSKDNGVSPNLTILPAFGVFLLLARFTLICVKKKIRLKSSKARSRGDVETWDDINYGILYEGDKHFCHVDIRGDGSSLYDTINSLGMLGNGNLPSPTCGHHPYQDSVTSYKSLVMQRADGSQYDSVKSYKAFLQRVTQNKDLAVEVKQLKNYPIKCKSAEHFVVVEEESSDKPETSIASKVLSALPLRKQFSALEKLMLHDKKKTRGRFASGDLHHSGHRKRSASNPTSRRAARRTAASSLPSIQCHGSSSDSSEEDTFRAFREDRRRKWAERKKMCRSVSGSRIASGGVTSGATVGGSRRRHYSADSARRLKKPYLSSTRNDGGGSQDSCLDTAPNALGLLSAKPKAKNKSPVKRQPKVDRNDSETSENPTSSHSSCNNSAVCSDDLESNSDDEETKLCSHITNMSDDQTIDDNDVFLSAEADSALSSSVEFLNVPSARNVLSSSELLNASSSSRSLSNSRKLLAQAKEDFMIKEPKPASLDLAVLNSKPWEHVNKSLELKTARPHSALVEGYCDSKKLRNGKRKHGRHTNGAAVHCHSKNSLLSHGSNLLDVNKIQSVLKDKNPAATSIGMSKCSAGKDVETSGKLNIDAGVSSGISVAGSTGGPSATDQGQVTQSPRKVQRFHVTFVNNSDISSLNSE